MLIRDVQDLLNLLDGLAFFSQLAALSRRTHNTKDQSAQLGGWAPFFQKHWRLKTVIFSTSSAPSFLSFNAWLASCPICHAAAFKTLCHDEFGHPEVLNNVSTVLEVLGKRTRDLEAQQRQILKHHWAEPQKIPEAQATGNQAKTRIELQSARHQMLA